MTSSLLASSPRHSGDKRKPASLVGPLTAKQFFDELESQQLLEEALVVSPEKVYPEKMNYYVKVNSL